MEHTIIYSDPHAYSCFPAILRRANGELWVSFRRAGGFSVEAVHRGQYDHVDKGARIALTRSTDGGRTWAPARLLPPFDPECGEQDPSLAELRDGTLLINFFRWRVVPPAEQSRLRYPARQQYDGSWSDVEGPWVIRSTNGGATWDAQPTLVSSAPLPRAGTSDAILELPDGTLLMGIYGADYGSRVCRAYVVRSTDGGRTWGEPALIARDPNGAISFEEPALARLPSGRLIAMLRSGAPGNYQYLHQSFSDDAGRTWSAPERTPLWGHPAHVLLLRDGRLLCSYGYRRPPFGVRACVSADGGRSWDMAREIVLRDDGSTRDVGYPSTAQLPDGTLVTAYYIHGVDAIRHIAATRWTLEPNFRTLDQAVQKPSCPSSSMPQSVYARARGRNLGLSSNPMFDVLITHGTLIDGTSAPPRPADLAIADGKIAALGDLGEARAAQHIDATGRVICPGFIDIHSHSDLTLLANRWTENRLRQGITTEVLGQDGLGYAPARASHLQEWRRYLVGLNGDFPEIAWNWRSVGELLARYDRRAANVVYLIPHGAVRVEVMGWEARPARPAELRAMAELVRQGLAEGAAGLSTGLTYIPCAHATIEELIALCEPVAQAGGIYAPHLRSYGAGLLAALDEAIEIGRRARVAVQVSHLRVADPSNVGLVGALLERIDRARAEGVDVTFDGYPYIVGCAPLFALLPASAQSGGPDAILARMRDNKTTQRIAAEMESWPIDWSWYTLSNAPKTALGAWEGAVLADAARATGLSAPLFIQQLLLETELNATIIARGGSLADNDALFQHPAAMVCSDGVMIGGRPHPRGYGAFPRFIAEYVRERGLLTLPDAIRKMSGLPAARLNFPNRGILRTGAAADVVIFSPDRIAAGADFDAGRRAPRGIDWVFVNGHAVVAEGTFCGGDYGMAGSQ